MPLVRAHGTMNAALSMLLTFATGIAVAQDAAPPPPVLGPPSIPGIDIPRITVPDLGAYVPGLISPFENDSDNDSGNSGPRVGMPNPAQGGGQPRQGMAGVGAGGAQTTTSNAPTANKKDTQQPPCQNVGDPIDLSSGNKFDYTTDFAIPVEMGLHFTRYYVSSAAHGNPHGIATGGWSDSLDYELYAECTLLWPGSCNTASFMRPDGAKIYFSQQATASNAASLTGPFTQVGGGLATLTYHSNGAGVPGTYVVVDEDAEVYTFTENAGTSSGMNGILTSIQNASGIGWTITHPSSSVTSVIHTSGQTMTLTTSLMSTPDGDVAALTVTDPAGTNYIYQSTPQNGLTFNYIPQVLGQVTLPGSTPVTVNYKYAKFDPSQPFPMPKGLIEADMNGVAHDITTYYTDRQVELTSMADGSQMNSVVYTANSTGRLAKVTNALGHVTEYQFNAQGLLSGITGDPSAHCAGTSSPTTYDANGFMSGVTDNNGVATSFTYLPTGQLSTKVEAVGRPEQRTTTYTWDTTPGTDRVLSIEVAGFNRTTYTYNAQNRLASVAVTNLTANGVANQTLTTTYGYTLYSNGMVKTMTVTHPSPGNTNVDTYQYDTLGNLTSVADGLGHTTTNGNYTALGKPQHIVGPNGDVTDFTYDARSLTTSVTTYPNGVPATTQYQYDIFGAVSLVTSPDGQITQYNRDAYGMLRTVNHNDKDGASTATYGYDAMGNVTSYALARGSTTALSWTASYDELGRLYTKLGNHGQSLAYTYDLNGNTKTITDASGHIISYGYDGLSRVTSTTESGGATVFPPTGSTSVTLPSTNTSGSYTVSWTAVTSATTYKLEELAGGNWGVVQNTGASSWTTSGKSNGTYSYRVTACNSAGCGPVGSTGSVSVVLIPTSAPTVSVPATNNTGAYGVAWNAVSNATSYTLQESVNGGGWSTVQATGATSWATSGRGSATYRYQVQACSSSGCGPVSGGAQTVVTLPPTGVPTLSAPATNYTGSYSVSWTGVAAATSYELDQQVNGGGWTAVQNAGSTSWGAAGEGSATYGYRVRACNVGGCAAYSGTANTAVTLPPGSAPAISTPGTNGSGQFSISWSGVGGATSYNVIESINGGGWTNIQSGASTSWTSGAGTPTGSYDFEVQACNIAGCGAWSALGRVAETQPIAINGQTYTGSDIIAQGKSGSAIVGFQILSGSTWQVYTSFYNNGTGGHVFGRASGAVPTNAVSIQTTWTFVGYPAGMGDAGGSWNSPATSPVSLSTNPVTTYTTATWPQTSPDRGRIYQLRIDFYNAIGVNISSSTATMIGETTGSP